MDARELIQSRSDIRRIGRAVRERWPIPDNKRAQIVGRLIEIVESYESDPRDIVAASRVLAAIDKMNIDIEGAAASLTFDELKEELRYRLSEMQQDAGSSEKQKRIE